MGLCESAPNTAFEMLSIHHRLHNKKNLLRPECLSVRPFCVHQTTYISEIFLDRQTISKFRRCFDPCFRKGQLLGLYVKSLFNVLDEHFDQTQLHVVRHQREVCDVDQSTWTTLQYISTAHVMSITSKSLRYQKTAVVDLSKPLSICAVRGGPL